MHKSFLSPAQMSCKNCRCTGHVSPPRPCLVPRLGMDPLRAVYGQTPAETQDLSITMSVWTLPGTLWKIWSQILPKDTQDPGQDHTAIRPFPFCTSCLLHPQPGALTLAYPWGMQTISRGCPSTTLPRAAFLNYLPPAATLGVPKLFISLLRDACGGTVSRRPEAKLARLKEISALMRWSC